MKARMYKYMYITIAAGLGGSIGCASDWRQEVAGSTPAEVVNILSWRLIMKYFLSILSFPQIQEGQLGQLSVSGERMGTILVNRLDD